jgi:nucleotide-binding universal stress UspA family protein
MQTLLVAVDGSAYSDRAVDYVIALSKMLKEPITVHLLNVQLPLTGVNVKLFVSKESLNEHYKEQGSTALESARQRLEQAGIVFHRHIGVGDPGQVIVDFAVSEKCDQIVVGARGRGAVTGAVLGSVAQKVAQRAKVPVVLVK